MGEYTVGGQFWSTYWSNDGEHETGENFYTEEEREQKALVLLRKGWTVAFGDFAGLQERLMRLAREYDESQQVQKDRVDELIGLLDQPVDCPADRPADPDDPLMGDYWAWFKRLDEDAWAVAFDKVIESGEMDMARQEDFNCWKDRRHGILDAWNAWKHAHPMNATSALMQHKFIESLPEDDQVFLQEMPDLLTN